MYKFLLAIILIVVPLYPKFPLLGIEGTFVSVRLEDVLLALVYLVWGVWAIRNRVWQKFSGVERSIIIFWLVGAVSTFSAIFLTKTASPNLGILHFLRRVEYMAIFFVGYAWLQKLADLKFVVRCLLLVSLLVALYGLGQQFAGLPVISTNNSEFSKGLALQLGPGARINSTFAGHYDLAAFSILPLVLILGLVVSATKHRYILIVIGLLSYWAMLLSASRVSFVALFASATLLLVLLRKFNWFPALIVLAVVGILGTPQLIGRYRELIVNHLKISFVGSVHAAVEDELPDALKPPAAAEDRSLNIRLRASWPRALRSFAKNPVLGTGYSSVGLASDNDYLRMVAETGALGLVAFGLIFWRFVKGVWPVLRKPGPELREMFIAGVTCYLFGLLLTAVFIDVFEASKIAIVSWMLFGMAYKAVRLGYEN